MVREGDLFYPSGTRKQNNSGLHLRGHCSFATIAKPCIRASIGCDSPGSWQHPRAPESNGMAQQELRPPEYHDPFIILEIPIASLDSDRA